MSLNKRERRALISLCRTVHDVSDDQSTKLRAENLITKLSDGVDVVEMFESMFRGGQGI